MIALLSSAKTLDFSTPWSSPAPTKPECLDDAKAIMRELRKLSPMEIQRLMGISPKLAQLNAERFATLGTTLTRDNAKPALLAYQGDVYAAMGSTTFGKDDLAFAQRTLRIISGLYGIVRPLDLIQPYRLEMAIKLAGPRWRDLYDFWSARVTRILDRDIRADAGLLINLASQEYFKTLDASQLGSPVLTLTFKQDRRGRVEMVPILAKRARGLMAGFIVRQRITDPTRLRDFDVEGYRFAKDQSHDAEWVFVRSENLRD